MSVEIDAILPKEYNAEISVVAPQGGGAGGGVPRDEFDLLAGKVDEEIERAKDAEKANADAIADEATRAKNAERELQKQIDELPTSGGGTVAELMQEVTYNELVALRDNNTLVAGVKYRITDYVTTTVQKNTKSANHPFDVIVEAVSENQLSELAQAIQHDGDTYFEGNDLGAWQLWYDLNNDIDKYEWADAENGKGVIYRMIDEKRNDCPYDFKNILFYNNKYTSNTTSDKYYYTFSYVAKRVLYDGTVEKRVTKCHSNSLGVYCNFSTKYLNKITFLNSSFGDDCYSNTFGDSCYSNTFGVGCYSNTFGNNCYSNTFGVGCYYNTFGDSCYSNTFGKSCYYNTFGDSCSYNTFANFCSYNTFGNNCFSNTFGVGCYYNTFGDSCYSNTFGDSMTNRQINNKKTSITLNEEYYDDETNALVPIKHPDLSTQPSILPYKFIGHYVYEQLIPIASLCIDGGAFFIPKDFFLNKEILVFDCAFVGLGYFFRGTFSQCPPNLSYLGEGYIVEGTGDTNDAVLYKYIKIVYSTIPTEGNNYGYNNY